MYGRRNLLISECLKWELFFQDFIGVTDGDLCRCENVAAVADMNPSSLRIFVLAHPFDDDHRGIIVPCGLLTETVGRIHYGVDQKFSG